MIAALILLRDTMAWWGAFAWIISLDDAQRWLRATPRPKQVRAISPTVATLAMAILCVGLIIVGVTIPLNGRVGMFEVNLIGFRLPTAAGWTLVSIAGWMFVCARASKPGMMVAVAGLALGGTVLAAALTAGAA